MSGLVPLPLDFVSLGGLSTVCLYLADTTPVHAPSFNIWQAFKETKAPLSMADWFSIDKSAYKNVRDGLRYLHGRSVKSGGAAPMVVGDAAVMNGEDDVLVGSTGAVDGAPGYDSDSDDSWLSDGEVDRGAAEDGYETDDTEYFYPYDYNKMRSSKSFCAPIVIGSTVVNAVFDSGASVSVIGSDWAQKLELSAIRAAGKLRPEHMRTKTNGLCLLGMLWFTTYGIKQDLKQCVLVIPTKNNTELMELYGDYLNPTSGAGGECASHDIPLVPGATPITSKPFRLTWFKAYGVKQDYQHGLLSLPTTNGADYAAADYTLYGNWIKWSNRYGCHRCGHWR
ncbi:hypothetical protein [Absidia glauca]|uniref:Uncharacterized protein n=1 Tax=Absidia glauca TaxID=4829 RepID=A0A168P2V9_ABSGL|nr:hypothetical protein [Absidia glauca]